LDLTRDPTYGSPGQWFTGMILLNQGIVQLGCKR
jgi:hypothetical protein